MWNAIRSPAEVPNDRDLRLAVLEQEKVHALAFPCRLRDGSWVDAKTGRRVEVYPTHWQEWQE